jgi:hypothetical protein
MQQRPPKVLEWAKGMRNLEGEKPRERAQSRTDDA